MRLRLLFLLFAAAIASGLRAETPELLDRALQKLEADKGHWAYTQTTQSYDKDGKPDKGLRVERFDPSKPEDEQWTLLQVEGRDATAKEVAAWKKKRPSRRGGERDKTLGEVIDFPRAKVADETKTVVIYEIPLTADATDRFPTDKFVVLMQVNKERAVIERVAGRTTETFRVRGVARVDAAEVDVAFGEVDPAYAPQPVTIKAGGQAKVFFFRVGGKADLTRSDFKRVKPYADRFGVEIGELKTLDF